MPFPTAQSFNLRRDYFTLGQRQVHYREAGDPGAPPLMLLHQTPSCSAMFEPLMQALAADFHLFAPDIAGMGMSDPLPDGEHVRGYAADFLALGEARIGRAFAVFGHHTGAAIGVQMAVDRADAISALVLSGPPYLDDAQRRALVSGVAAAAPDRAGAHLAALWQRMAAKDANAPLALLEREYRGAIQLGGRYQAAYAAVAAQPFADQFRTIACRLLLVAGSHDSLRPCLDAAAAARPDAQVAEIAGATTYVCETETAALASLVRRFLLPGPASESPYSE